MNENTATVDDLQYELFKVVATELMGKIQQACTLAANLEEFPSAFDLMHNILNKCIEEVSRYEGEVMKRRGGFTPIDTVEGESDGN